MDVFKTGFFLLAIQLIWLVAAQEQDKRIPQGFVGMRGKKLIDNTDKEHYLKRKPQFFIGVKGRKRLIDALKDDISSYYKRTPMGFVGMRGKRNYMVSALPQYMDSYDYMPRSGGSLIGQIDYSTNDDLTNSIGGEFPLLDDLLDGYLQKLSNQKKPIDEDKTQNNDEGGDNIGMNIVEKRAVNSQQFFGVRGKKLVQNKRPYDLTFRGKFIGVRGKKDTNSVDHEKFLSVADDPWTKRKAQMGFFGMRGKKWSDDESSPESASIN